MTEILNLLLLTGGVDSTIAFYYMQEFFAGDIALLNVPTQHRYASQERDAIHALKRVDPDFGNIHFAEGVLNLMSYEDEDAHIPLRNLLLASVGSMHILKRMAKQDTEIGKLRIAIPCQLGEMSIPDRSQEFFNKTGELLSMLLEIPVLLVPIFDCLTKVGVVEWFLTQSSHDSSLAFRYSILSRTFSCYRPTKHPTIHCGDCPACVRKWISFKLNQCEDLHSWRVNPRNSVTFQRYLIDVEEGKYPGPRGREIERAWEEG